MKVSEWMSPDPVTVPRSSAFADARSMITERGIRHLPVVDDRGQLCGMLSDRDVLSQEDSDATVGTKMSHPVHTLEPTATIADAARAMLSRRINALPVVEAGRLVGLVTSSDCLLALLETSGEPGSEATDRASASESPSSAELRKMSIEECMAFLEPRRLGRMAFVRDDRPEVLPLNYRWHAGSIIVRIGYGSLLADIDGHVVAFEVDDADSGSRGSVVIHGLAAEVWQADEIAQLDDLGLRPWAPGRRDHYVSITATSMTGRIIG